jgi:trigger factor
MQTAEHPSEFLVGEEVKVSVQRKPACQVEFRVLASKKLIDKARAQAVKSVGKEVVLPGFRKGKAPEVMIAKKFPQDIEKQSHKELADLAFPHAQKVAQISLLNQQSKVVFDVIGFREDEAELKFLFETDPTVPSVDPKRFVPKEVERKEVGEKELNEAIRQMAFFYAQWEVIENRPIQEGDCLIVDLDTVDGDKIERVFTKIRFEVAPDKMAGWMYRLVLNAKMGDVVEGLSEVDEGASEAERSEFKPKKVRLHIAKVETAALPPIDDEFAKKVGAQDVAGMREMVKGILVRQVEEHVLQALREQVNDFLSKEYLFDVPRSLEEAEVRHRYTQAMKNPKFKKQMEGSNQEERKNVAHSLQQEAVQALRLFYLSQKIIEEAKIAVTNQDVQNMVVELRRKHGGGLAADPQVEKEEYALALSTLLLTRAQDFIIAQQKA